MNADRDQDPMGGAQGAVAEDDLATELEALRSSLAEAEAHRNALLRAVAEADNARKRAQRDIEAAGRFGAERLAADLLEVVRHDFSTLQARYGSVVATTFRDGSYPQRYVDVLDEQPVAPAVVVEPFKEAPGRALFTEDDLVVRDFSRTPAIVPVCAA